MINAVGSRHQNLGFYLTLDAIWVRVQRNGTKTGLASRRPWAWFSAIPFLLLPSLPFLQKNLASSVQLQMETLFYHIYYIPKSFVLHCGMHIFVAALPWYPNTGHTSNALRVRKTTKQIWLCWYRQVVPNPHTLPTPQTFNTSLGLSLTDSQTIGAGPACLYLSLGWSTRIYIYTHIFCYCVNNGIQSFVHAREAFNDWATLLEKH